MSIEDDLRQALHEGRLGLDQVILMNPADFNELRSTVGDFGEWVDGTTILGRQVFSTPHQERGSVRIAHRSQMTRPPRMVIHPDHLSTLSDEIDRELSQPALIVPSGTFQRPIFIPASECGEASLVKKATPAKTLWQRLEEDE